MSRLHCYWIWAWVDGKTVITLTAIEHLMYQEFEIRKPLIIAPLRVAKNTWPAEIQKWDHLRGLTWSVAVGTAEERKAALGQKADIYIINRENVQWLVEESGLPFDYDMLVIDELSSFKSWQAKRFKSLMKVRPRVKRIVGLTGTPSSNGLMDLFAEFKLLDMGKRLGRFIGQYRNAFFTPERMNGPIVYSYRPLPGAEDEIYRRIGDITISMKTGLQLKMPELITMNYEVEMSYPEKRQYAKMKRELMLSLPDGEVTASNAAVLTGKLLQLSSGAIYADDGSVIHLHDRKLDALEDIIEGMNGKPLLVAYWFKHDYDRIAGRLTKLGIAFERLDSEASMRRWNAEQIQVALAHPASTGHGLNLQEGGSTICWFTPTWSLELYQQMNARLYRQGQKDETVVIMHIVTKDTVDSKVLKALSEKDRIQEALINAVKAEVKA
jgi:Superfamily II DNA/RNA helicases, SNF2 family